MKSEFKALKSNNREMTPYGAWFNQPLNNAQLLSVSTYHDWVPAFDQMLSDTGGDLARFYDNCQNLAQKAPQERQRILTERLQYKLAAEH